MKLKELKNWLNNIPEEEFDNYTLVFRRIEEIDEEHWGAHDVHIATCGVDVGNKEVYLCDEYSAQIIEGQ